VRSNDINLATAAAATLQAATPPPITEINAPEHFISNYVRILCVLSAASLGTRKRHSASAYYGLYKSQRWFRSVNNYLISRIRYNI